VNDVLARRFDAEAFERDYDHVIGVLAGAAGRGVLTMTLHDVAAGLPVPRAARVSLRRRIARANVVIERVSERHGAWVLDARLASPMGPLGMLSIDRLHPNRRGHRYMAASALDVLREHGAAPDGPAAVVPPADPVARRIAAEARHLWWLGRHLVVPAVRGRYPRVPPGAVETRRHGGP
jgi:hypothetical protein